MHTLHIILSIVAIAALIVYAFVVSFSSNRGTQNLTAITASLRLLNARFEANEIIDADHERKEMEILQNKVKTSCDSKAITASAELRLLFAAFRKHVTRVSESLSIKDQSAWIKLKALTSNFDDSYFGPGVNRTL